jgi:hypothetical protein
MSPRATAIGALAVVLAAASCDTAVRDPGETSASLTGASSGGVPGACSPGFEDCNGDASDGCEADLRSDGDHCGACDRSCLSQPCEASLCVPEVLADGLYFPRRISLADGAVYWTTPDSICRSPSKGGEVEVLAEGLDDAYDITVGEGVIVWTDIGSDEVTSMPMDGGPPAVLVQAGNPFAITILDGYAYFTDTYNKASSDERVTRVPLEGGAPFDIVLSTEAKMLALDSESLYFTDPINNTLQKAPASGGGEPSALATGIFSLGEVAEAGDDVYFTGLEGTFKAPKSGGDVTPLAYGSSHGLAVDATHVYFSAYDGRVHKVPREGGAATALAQSDLYAGDLAVDETHVYWILNRQEGTLLRVAK